jgi:peptide methionine sulfoxide reductase msrA/msrB
MMNPTLAALVGTLSLLACTTASDAQPPAKKMAKPDGPREVAILAAGCFWGVEHWMMKVDGVVSVDVGYIGGKSNKVSYEQVSEGGTGHAEAVRIVFDPSVTSYDKLLTFFMKIHDPTTKNRQGNDVGAQYRSAIFPMTDAQKQTASTVLARIEKTKAWGKPLTTTIEAPTNWVTAEDYHQDYLVKNPGGYDNHFLRPYSF